MLIDATINLDDDPDPQLCCARFPPTVWPDKDDIEKAFARWSELGLGKPKGGSPSPRGSDKSSRSLPTTEHLPMTQTAVTIPSAGLKLSGVVHVPDDVRPGERRAAFLVLHGFGSNKNSSNTMEPTKVLTSLGYVVLRFDMRGCGESEGERGNLICLEQVEDTSSALTFLAKHPAVDPNRIGVIGSSFGGAVAAYAGGVDPRVAAVISNGGWGDGERKFRGQHPAPRPGRSSPTCSRWAAAIAPSTASR